MRVLSLDVGDKRIGVAISDPLGVTATPLTAIHSTGTQYDIEAVLRLAEENEATEIVVGLPISLSGHIGPQAKRVQRFIRKLSEVSPIPVSAQDERYSSVESERLLRASGAEPSKNRARVDATAAAIILQAYLDSRGN